MIAVLAVAAATAATFVVYTWIAPSISLLFFPAILVAAVYGGYGPALLATVLSALSLAFYFVPPRYSFDVGVDDAARLAVFVMVALATTSISQARRRAEEALARRVREAAIQEDRLRVSRDLHDGILQALTGIRLELQAIADDDQPSATRDRLLALERALAIEQRELRLLIGGLKPASIVSEPVGPLAVRLEELCGRLSTEWRAPISVAVDPVTLVLSSVVKQVVVFMVHEAVVNALKHAHPSRVSVSVRARAGGLEIVVRDDGRGFAFRGKLDHEMLVAEDAGPASLRHRVHDMGGRMAIESTPSGSTVAMTLPASAL